jgi:squalene-associated FAD-dependent desaturase
VSLRLAVVGAGWAGMAAAVQAASMGAQVTVFEATRELGGRARGLCATRSDGAALMLDNGQHILIGAYSEALALMQRVGVDLDQALMAIPLGLPFPDGSGLQTPPWAARWPAPLDAVAAIATARGWTWGERWALVRASVNWKQRGFACAPVLTVGELCASLPARVMDELIEPLCVSALNLPAAQAGAQVFLNVMRDALFGRGHNGWAASSLLLPRQDLSRLFPATAAKWLQSRSPGFPLRLGCRVLGIARDSAGWRLHGDGFEDHFDRVIWATAARPAALALADFPGWASTTAALDFTAITTVYAWAPGVRLSAPMLALRGAPAQFVFDRGQLCPGDASAQGVLAFVISASVGEREVLQHAVLAQAAQQLGLSPLRPLQTVVEKRATFACTPGLQRPPPQVAPGLWAAGDYVHGPYPATLEGAVRSGLLAARLALEG